MNWMIIYIEYYGYCKYLLGSYKLKPNETKVESY